MSIQFETPENILLSYQPAGLGSRFIAFLIDWVFMLIPLFILVVASIYAVSKNPEIADKLVTDEEGNIDFQNIIMYSSRLYFVLLGILSVAYFGLFELLMRGQTPGKKIMKLRVVNTDGFRLQAPGIAIRSVFRVVDTIPLFWSIPFVSKNYQRLGDFVGHTLVVHDSPPDEDARKFREELLELNGQPSRTFSPAAMEKIPAATFEAATRMLQRWKDLPVRQQRFFSEKFCAPLAHHLSTPEPDMDSCPNFLLDLLLTEFRRQYRKLG